MKSAYTERTVHSRMEKFDQICLGFPDLKKIARTNPTTLRSMKRYQVKHRCLYDLVSSSGLFQHSTQHGKIAQHSTQHGKIAQHST